MPAIHPSRDFSFVPSLESAFDAIRTEFRALPQEAFAESLDSLTTVSPPYDETGWRYFDLFGADDFESNRRLCPETAAVVREVPGLVNAGLSLFQPGTHLYPHGGEMKGVLRCHLPLQVPEGDVALLIDGREERWSEGRCLVFDDTYEHEAWNRGDSDRVLLLVTFRHPETKTARTPD